MSSQKIRIRLKGYDHEVIDQSAKLIVDTAQLIRLCVSTFQLVSISRSSSKHTA